MRKEIKNGVTYTFETDDLSSEAVDVEVQPGIEYLILEYGLNMPESKRSFPEVKYLTIQKGVESIEIPNTLFPNVKRVISKNIRSFESGRYLVDNLGGRTLKNVFCPAEDEVIEIPDVIKKKGRGNGYEFTDGTVFQIYAGVCNGYNFRLSDYRIP